MALVHALAARRPANANWPPGPLNWPPGSLTRTIVEPTVFTQDLGGRVIATSDRRQERSGTRPAQIERSASRRTDREDPPSNSTNGHLNLIARIALHTAPTRCAA